MKASVIVRSRDEAPRLRLVLASLSRQSPPAEIVVVDDGSSDATAQVIAAAAGEMAIQVVSHDYPRGRAAAANAGAAAAGGDVLIFLDGDTLAGPEMVAGHLATHARSASAIGRGETWHLRCTRPFSDPAAGIPFPDQATRVAAMSPDERARATITPDQVLAYFGDIATRGSPGVYPGAAPRRLHALEVAALRERPDSALLWAAASGSNFSVRREAFRAAGGFDPALDINEHRELALRLCAAGGRMMAAEGARTYHMIHRSGWRDPLAEGGWEQAFRRAHPAAPLDRLKAFWRSLSDADATDLWGEGADGG